MKWNRKVVIEHILLRSWDQRFRSQIMKSDLNLPTGFVMPIGRIQSISKHRTGTAIPFLICRAIRLIDCAGLGLQMRDIWAIARTLMKRDFIPTDVPFTARNRTMGVFSLQSL